MKSSNYDVVIVGAGCAGLTAAIGLAKAGFAQPECFWKYRDEPRDIVDPDEFQKYPPVVLSLLPKYGGEVLASDTSALLVEGTARTMNAIIRFPTKDAALALYNDPAYQEAKRIRQASTRNVSMVLVDEFTASN